MPSDRLLHPKAGKSRKVSALTDLEYRVWTQYLLSADDFGVMRCSAVKLQADNDCLATKPARVLARCLDALAACGLLQVFEHQGQRYVFQGDWQNWQKVEYPRGTDNPPPHDLSACDEATRTHFAKHPGGQRKDRRRPEGVPNDSAHASHAHPENSAHASRTHSEGVPNVSRTYPEDVPNTSRTHPEGIPTTRARVPAERLTANGIRLTANGSEGVQGEPSTPPPMDEWARRLVELYPAQGRVGWNLVESLLFTVLTADPAVPPAEAWAALQARLEAHTRSHQWRIKRMIPRLDRWLRDGAHLQELPADASPSDQLSPRSARTLAAASKLLGEA